MQILTPYQIGTFIERWRIYQLVLPNSTEKIIKKWIMTNTNLYGLTSPWSDP